jgi:hypothetical protein
MALGSAFEGERLKAAYVTIRGEKFNGPGPAPQGSKLAPVVAHRRRCEGRGVGSDGEVDA